jgi:fatty acid desaturase
MRLHPEELELARAYNRSVPSNGLSPAQMRLVMDRGRELHHWFKNHQAIHAVINLSVMVLIFAADYAILLRMPRWLLGQQPNTWKVVVAALVTGALHSWLMYSLTVYSMHEGAAHGVAFPHDDPVSRVMNRIVSNLCRVAAAEPREYSVHHMSHHAKFGTEQDGEFLNFVQPRRYWLTLLPFANIINYSDFLVHRPLTYTRGRILSGIVALCYHIGFGYLMTQSFGLTFTLVTFVLFVPHVGFYLDRLRQYTEHNLMPLENKDGSRSFGLGFWGMLIGGGPWGSPCHWEHHLVASLPWYQQLILHRDLKRILTPVQRKKYLLQPVVGYPRLLWSLWQEPLQFQRRIERAQQAMAAGAQMQGSENERRDGDR